MAAATKAKATKPKAPTAEAPKAARLTKAAATDVIGTCAVEIVGAGSTAADRYLRIVATALASELLTLDPKARGGKGQFVGTDAVAAIMTKAAPEIDGTSAKGYVSNIGHYLRANRPEALSLFTADEVAAFCDGYGGNVLSDLRKWRAATKPDPKRKTETDPKAPTAPKAETETETEPPKPLAFEKIGTVSELVEILTSERSPFEAADVFVGIFRKAKDAERASLVDLLAAIDHRVAPVHNMARGTKK